MTQIFHAAVGLRKRQWALPSSTALSSRLGTSSPGRGGSVLEMGRGCDTPGPAWMGRWQRCCWWGSGCSQAPARMVGLSGKDRFGAAESLPRPRAVPPSSAVCREGTAAVPALPDGRVPLHDPCSCWDVTLALQPLLHPCHGTCDRSGGAMPRQGRDSASQQVLEQEPCKTFLLMPFVI